MGKIADWLLYIGFGLLFIAAITSNVYVVMLALALVCVSGFFYGLGTWYIILLKDRNLFPSSSEEQDQEPFQDNSNSNGNVGK